MSYTYFTYVHAKLGVVGAVGMLLCLNKKIEVQYAWGICIAINNQVEFIAPLNGLDMEIEKKILKFMIFGDSLIVI